MYPQDQFLNFHNLIKMAIQNTYIKLLTKEVIYPKAK